MRILLINKYHYKKGGAERAYFDTARILAENGHSVAFFSMEHPDNLATPWSKYFVSAVDYLDEKQSVWKKIQAAFSIIWNFEAARNLEALIVEFGPEVAHLHNTYHQLSPSILWVLKRHHIPVVMTLHDYKAVSPNYSLFVRGKIWEHTSGFRTIIDRAIKDSFLKSMVCALELWFHKLIGSYKLVDQFIAPSQFLIDKYKEFGFPYAIQRIAQPLSPFPGRPEVFGSGKYFLFAGRLSSEKGAETLLEVFSQIPEERLLVAGTGPDEERLKLAYGRCRNIQFLGHLTGKSLEKIFHEAKAFVLPSEWYENMPYSLLEALSFGLPVIGSRLGGTVERIREGENGFLFEPGNRDDLKRVIGIFKQSHQVSMGEAAWESIQDLREEKYYQALVSLYRHLIDSLDKKL